MRICNSPPYSLCATVVRIGRSDNQVRFASFNEAVGYLRRRIILVRVGQIVEDEAVGFAKAVFFSR